MKDVYDLSDKDTGDVAGDTSFVLSRRTSAYGCKVNPNSFYCNGIAQFDGDDANSTDVVLEMNVLFDGTYAQYLMCNPVNTSDPTGAWHCDTTITKNPPNYPEVCSANNVAATVGLCFMDLKPVVTKKISLGDCCTEISNGLTFSGLTQYDHY